MLFFISCTQVGTRHVIDLNTSHVILYLTPDMLVDMRKIDLNTSHVILYPGSGKRTGSLNLHLNTSHVILYPHGNIGITTNQEI